MAEIYKRILTKSRTKKKEPKDIDLGDKKLITASDREVLGEYIKEIIEEEVIL